MAMTSTGTGDDAREVMGSGDDLLVRHLLCFGLWSVLVAAAAFHLLAHLALLPRRRYGAWAVVTGPMSSIGHSVALELERLFLNLVLGCRDPASLLLL